jgi:DNA-binding transcriptional ArsR family regulator
MAERYKKVSFYIILYMNKILLDTNDIAENEDSMIFNLRPEFNRICYNSIRASIIHLLVKSKELNHSLSVEEIAYKLGKRHSVVIHHLEKLNQCKIVEIIRLLKYGDKERRSIWGLNMKYPNLVQTVYTHMLKTFYTANELDRLCSINKDARSEIDVV